MSDEQEHVSSEIELKTMSNVPKKQEVLAEEEVIAMLDEEPHGLSEVGAKNEQISVR
jgi:hypothetical protein